MKATLALIALAVGTYALKSAGPLALGGRELRKSISRVATLLPAALLAALVVVATFSNGRSLTLDARAAGLAAAAIALVLRAPFIVVVLVAILVTAAVRL